ncbi:MAG: hypothetical protein LLG37_05770 [Spirochaetia bacterium]|nr:hypothetical protein [Spirochaetia bacterium]
MNYKIFAVLLAFGLSGCASPGVNKTAPEGTGAAANTAPFGVTASAQVVDMGSATAAANAGQILHKKGDGGSKAADKKNEKSKGEFKVRELVINSDTLRFNRDTSEAIFSGHVVAEASNVIIYSDELHSKDYRDNAQAFGNVRAVYKEQNVVINCKRMDYREKLTKVCGYDDVVVRKLLDDGNTMTMRCDVIEFNAGDNVLYARRVTNRVRVTLKDVMAFADTVSYSDPAKEMEFTGNPLLKKNKSVFISDNIRLDVEKKMIRMKDNIFTRLFPKDVEGARRQETGKSGVKPDGGKP